MEAFPPILVTSSGQPLTHPIDLGLPIGSAPSAQTLYYSPDPPFPVSELCNDFSQYCVDEPSSILPASVQYGFEPLDCGPPSSVNASPPPPPLPCPAPTPHHQGFVLNDPRSPSTMFPVICYPFCNPGMPPFCGPPPRMLHVERVPPPPLPAPMVHAQTFLPPRPCAPLRSMVDPSSSIPLPLPRSRYTPPQSAFSQPPLPPADRLPSPIVSEASSSSSYAPPPLPPPTSKRSVAQSSRPPFSVNRTSTDSHDIIGFEVTPSHRVRSRGRNHLYAIPDSLQIPLLKKDKNIRFTVTFAENSPFVHTCSHVQFSQNANINALRRFMAGCLYISFDQMDCHETQSDGSIRWMRINKKNWTVLKVSDPLLEETCNQMTVTFELRFPNSQRKMMVRTNNNTFRFKMSFCCRPSPHAPLILKSSIFFVYRVDSNGKRRKDAVDRIKIWKERTRRGHVRLKSSVEVPVSGGGGNGGNGGRKRRRREVLLRHDFFTHSSLMRTEEVGV